MDMPDLMEGVTSHTKNQWASWGLRVWFLVEGSWWPSSCSNYHPHRGGRALTGRGLNKSCRRMSGRGARLNVF
eukprot:9391108-Pyramimonas_sp.AAC.1